MRVFKMSENNQNVMTASPLKDWQSCLANALHNLFNRLDEINSQSLENFPLYSIGNSNQWINSKGGSWMGGFWAGCWWLRAHLTQSAADYAKAGEICEKLSDKIELDSSYRSLIFWYGAALGQQFFQHESAQKITSATAQAITTAYDAKLLCVPLGSALGGGENGKNIITVDGLASLIDLLMDSCDGEYELIARQHTDTLIAACLTENGAFHSEAHYENGRFQTHGEAGDWSRGQAWAMLGLTRAAAHWGEPYLSKARLACDYWQKSRPQLLPLNRLSKTNGLIDPSATVIAALAMLSLAEQAKDGENWRDLARQNVLAVLESDYFNGGIFSGCCYKIKADEIALVESSWGTFLLMVAVNNLQNRKPTPVLKV
jgi:unsaturated chondroitin disaccharide hydrolase